MLACPRQARAELAGFDVGGFLANNLAPMVDEIAWLQDISPLRYCSGGEPLRNGVQATDLGVLLVASLVAVVVGGSLFDRRDVAV